ncbi:hypothetical protein C8J43_11125 [Sphingomonas sp. PP-CE-1G-424]|nr:hypothetical protein C8J43_11125 [Sphingomonas sp. PP-CE-1G-424]
MTHAAGPLRLPGQGAAQIARGPAGEPALAARTVRPVSRRPSGGVPPRRGGRSPTQHLLPPASPECPSLDAAALPPGDAGVAPARDGVGSASPGSAEVGGAPC